jgi:hypothetical protein
MPPKRSIARGTGKRKQSDTAGSSKARRLPEGQTAEAKSVNLRVILFVDLSLLR